MAKPPPLSDDTAVWSEVLYGEAFPTVRQLFVCGSEKTDDQGRMGLAPGSAQGLDLESLCFLLRTAHTVTKKQLAPIWWRPDPNASIRCDDVAVKQLFVCGSEEMDDQERMGLAPGSVQGLDLESLYFSGHYYFDSGSAVVLTRLRSAFTEIEAENTHAE
ncbi:unnamed protein product [Gongylonema pulchrum]|uniref:STYKc n=1 Tax=Gongylonema pulchrum TaxID=637853 RepID=A0A183EH29_9BILA|nr:unnamed protein product [Gongylonema pulchrum]